MCWPISKRDAEIAHRAREDEAARRLMSMRRSRPIDFCGFPTVTGRRVSF